MKRIFIVLAINPSKPNEIQIVEPLFLKPEEAIKKAEELQRNDTKHIFSVRRTIYKND